MSAVHKDKGTEPCASSSVQTGILELYSAINYTKYIKKCKN